MELIGNALNGRYMRDIFSRGECEGLQGIRMAVAYVNEVDLAWNLAKSRQVPLILYALADGEFPSLNVISRFVESGRTDAQLFLTRGFYHPKIIWLRGVGAYIGSANLTQGGLTRNLECGLWLDEVELARSGWDVQLDSMFRVIAGRSTAAQLEHLQAYRRIGNSSDLRGYKDRLKALVDRELQAIKGAESPHDPMAVSQGGVGRLAFIRQWNTGLTVLRKISKLATEYEWPAWQDRSSPPAIVQDRAMEHWYDKEIRNSGNATATIERLGTANRRDPEQAVRRIFERWTSVPASADLDRWVNHAPQRLRELLAREAIASMGVDQLVEALSLCHAAREHARQISKEELGLPHDRSVEVDERVEIFGRYLWGLRSPNGRTIREVIEYGIWGDAQTKECAERLWTAIYSEEWRLPHFGINMLGELIGYARPDEYPPRNGRVSKSLAALGYEGIDH